MHRKRKGWPYQERGPSVRFPVGRALPLQLKFRPCRPHAAPHPPFQEAPKGADLSLPLALRQAIGIDKILCMKALARLRPLPLTRTIASQVLPGVGVQQIGRAARFSTAGKSSGRRGPRWTGTRGHKAYGMLCCGMLSAIAPGFAHIGIWGGLVCLGNAVLATIRDV